MAKIKTSGAHSQPQEGRDGAMILEQGKDYFEFYSMQHG
jgi:hypothetical protein